MLSDDLVAEMEVQNAKSQDAHDTKRDGTDTKAPPTVIAQWVDKVVNKSSDVCDLK